MNIILVDLFVTYCLVVSVNAVGICLVSLTQRTRRWTRPFAFASLLTAVWAISFVIELRSDDFQTKLFLYNLRQTVIHLAPSYWLFIALEMQAKPQRLPFWVRLGFVIIPAITIALHWTSDAHTLIRQPVFMDTSTILPLLKSTRGELYWISAAHAILVSLATIVLFVMQYQRSASDERRLVVVLVFAFSLPALLSMLDLVATSTRLPFTLGLLGFLPVQLVLAWVYVLPLLRGRPTISYDLMFETMQDGVIVVNAKGRVIEINHAARQLFPLVTSFIDQPITALVNTWPQWQRAFQVDDNTRFELRIGSTSYDIHTAPLFTADGKLLGYLSTMRDITRLIQTQEELSASGERFRQLVTLMPFPLVLTSVKKGEVMYVNPKAEEVFLIKNDDAQTRFVNEFYADMQDRERMIEQVRRDGYAIIDDIRLQRSNGEIFWATLSTVHTELDGIDVLITSVNDISARKDIEERLRRSEALYRSIVTASPDGILTIDMNGNLQMASPSILRLLGYPPRLLDSQINIFTHIHPDDMQISAELLESFTKNNRTNALVTRLMHRDGHIIYTEVNGEIITDKNGVPSGILLIVRDITERRVIEQAAFEARLQREKIIAIDKLLHAASHDLRTPITVITTAAYLQQKLGTRIADNLVTGNNDMQVITDDLNKIIERAKSSELSARRLEQIVESMVEITRLESRIQLNLKPYALTSMLNDLTRNAIQRFQTKGLTLTVTLTELPIVWVDPIEIRKAIDKLIDNAYHYTPEGGYARVETLVTDEWLQVRVSDNGIGIEANDIKRVFDSFYRADPARSSNTGGAGLGLTIARRICELHGGRLEVQSTNGVGSTFTLSLPRTPPVSPHLGSTPIVPVSRG